MSIRVTVFQHPFDDRLGIGWRLIFQDDDKTVVLVNKGGIFGAQELSSCIRDARTASETFCRVNNICDEPELDIGDVTPSE